MTSVFKQIYDRVLTLLRIDTPNEAQVYDTRIPQVSVAAPKLAVFQEDISPDIPNEPLGYRLAWKVPIRIEIFVQGESPGALLDTYIVFVHSRIISDMVGTSGLAVLTSHVDEVSIRFQFTDDLIPETGVAIMTYTFHTETLRTNLETLAF
jgi:hypothetical protein